MSFIAAVIRRAAFLAALLVPLAVPAQLVPFPPAPVVKLAVNPVTNKVYSLNEFGDSVTVLDVAAGTSAVVPVGPRPQFIAVNPRTNRIYVNNAGNSTITIIDGATDTNLTPTPLDVGSHGPISINTATNVVYIVRLTSPATDEVTYFNGNTNTWYTIATESFQPIAMALNPVTDTIYVVHYATGDVRIISGTYNDNAHPATQSLGLWSKPVAVAANPVTNKIYAITEDARGPIFIIDGATRNAIFPLPASGHAQRPKAIAVNPVTNRIYAAFAGEVVVIDGATNAYTYVPVATGSGAVGLAVDPTSNRVYVSNADGVLTVIDGATNATSTVLIPGGASVVSVNPVTGMSYTFADAVTAVPGTGTPQANPIVTTIGALPGNSSGPQATFTIDATSGFSPTAPAIGNVYWQLDSRAGAWTAAAGSGPWTVSLSGLAAGSHTLHAFATDAQAAPLHSDAQAAVVGTIASYTFTVLSDAASVSLASSLNPSIQGQAVTFTATVAGNAQAPTGAVDFRDGGSAIAGCTARPLAGSAATCSIATLAAGSHSVTAHYSGDARYGAAASAALSQQVDARGTPTVSVSSSGNPSATGSPVTFSAAVTGSAGTATGTVAFRDGTIAIASCSAVALVSGSATCTTSSLSAGTHSITAAFSGDERYVAAISTALNQSVEAPRVAPTVAVTSSSNPSTAGASVAFTANVGGSAGPGTGTVAFRDGGTALPGCASVALADGTAACTAAALGAGTHTITVAYGGSSAYTAGTSADLSQVVNPAPTTPAVSLSSSANPSAIGAPVTFTATVTGSSGTATGTVDFRDGGASIAGCNAAALANGSATCTASSLSVGGHSITAAYGGDARYLAATSEPLNQAVDAARSSPNVTVASSRNPANAGETVTFTANVDGAAGPGTGTVAFRDGGSALPGCDSVPLSGGTATCAATALGVGTHAITVAYGGSSAYTANTSASLSQVVNPAPSTPEVTLRSSANPSFSGATVTFTATVSGSAGTATGSVRFLDGSDAIAGCEAITLASGSASCAVGTLAVGDHSISARYSGGDAYLAATSGTVTQQVQPVPPGEHPRLGLSATTLSFGAQSMGTSSQPRPVTLTNTGTGTLVVGTITMPQQFAQSNDCGALAAGQSCTLAVRFEPAIAAGPLNASIDVAGTIGIDSNSETGAASVQVSGTAQKSLVAHFYRATLDRGPDPSGAKFWAAEAQRMASLGVNVNEAWFAMAAYFYSSPEYVALGRDNTAFVTDLYRTFFNREPDPSGIAFWTGKLANGMPREVALVSFMFSPEFAGFTQAIFGNTAARAEVDAVLDFYRGVLARLPDDAGFDSYVNHLRMAQCAGQGAVFQEVDAVSRSFLQSPEYAQRARSDAQYVGDMYNTFLRRGGEASGVQFWIDELATGHRTREDVRQSFIASGEFRQRVDAIVAQGCMP